MNTSNLANLLNEENDLALMLESTTKHLSAYLKLKPHIKKLSELMQTEKRGFKTLEDLDLDSSVYTMMELLETLDEGDLSLLNTLEHIAGNWQKFNKNKVEELMQKEA